MYMLVFAAAVFVADAGRHCFECDRKQANMQVIVDRVCLGLANDLYKKRLVASTDLYEVGV
jgi:hypothetical protein